MAEIAGNPPTGSRKVPVSSTFIDIDHWTNQVSPSDCPASERAASFYSIPTAGVMPRKAASLIAAQTSAPLPEISLDGTNWIGKLLEYQIAYHSQPVIFTDSPAPGPGVFFTCTAKISEREEPFGDLTATFKKKKDAKQYAAKMAVEWLTSSGYRRPLDYGGLATAAPSVPAFPGAAGLAAAGKTQTATPPAPEESQSTSPVAAVTVMPTSTAARVPELCQKLNFPIPTYMLNPHPQSPALWSGYAHFNGDPRLPAKLGEFDFTYGKKKAKDACALLVLEYLEGVAKGMVVA